MLSRATGEAGSRSSSCSLQQFVDARAELGVALAQCGQFSVGDACAPLQPLADRGLNLVEVAGVNARCLPRLDGRKDLE